ncbi:MULTISPECIES: hypothetical protein [unclassified Clostridium]|uniref:hypothetical protein n=1 Tax=unclassified Clostridium TaxID=2614128 RepID=UPI0002F461E4|nr:MULTISPECIES: hypothetical protein [unclassified Clostridium]
MNNKLVFNKNELMDFTMMMGVNMMMFGVILGFISVMGQYIERIFNESKEKPVNIIGIIRNCTRTSKRYKVFNLELKTY